MTSAPFGGDEYGGILNEFLNNSMIIFDIDADILAWLKAQPLDWQREINNAARFVMDMSSQPVPPIEVYEADFETAGPDPERNADRIAHDFVP